VSGLRGKRAERLARSIDSLLPSALTPEQRRKDAEDFLDQWAAEITEEAHRARERRARGEPNAPVDHMSGPQISGEAVSYGPHTPPESIQTALHNLIHEEPVAGMSDAELTQAFNEATREALRRAFVLFAGE
jgi:hypothetical protein